MRAALAIAIGLLAAVLMTRGLDGRIPSPAAPTVTVDAAAVLRVASAARLETQTMEVAAPVTVARPETFPGIGGETIRMTVVGTVRAGVDLTELRPGDVTVDGGIVVVRLPDARVLGDPTLDEARTRVDDRQFSAIWSTRDDGLIGTARAEGARALRAEACRRGLLRAAADETARALGPLLAGVAHGMRVRIYAGARPC